MKNIQTVIQAGLSCRDKLNLGVRWPLSKIIVDSKDLSHSAEKLKKLIMKQLNVKDVVIENVDVQLTVKPNYKTLGKDFGNRTARVVELINENALSIADHIKNNKAFNIEGFEITTNHVIIEKICPPDYLMSTVAGGEVYLDKVQTPELEIEGYVREIIRRIQQLRKDSELNRRDVIELFISTELKIDDYQDMIAEKVGARKVILQDEGFNKYDAQVTEKIKGKDVKIMFNKVTK